MIMIGADTHKSAQTIAAVNAAVTPMPGDGAAFRLVLSRRSRGAG
jgi:hypothetical protein